jgi:arylsulfatase A-like enzyme
MSGMDGLAARGGCYPEKTGVMDLSTSLRKALANEVTLPQHFKDHGYATVLMGKVFHVPYPKTKLDVELGSSLHKYNEGIDKTKLTLPSFYREGGDDLTHARR